MTDQRIKLAEFVGWRNSKGWWIPLPDGNKRLEAFDPRNDANDCEALMNKLQEHGWIVAVIAHPDKAVIVSIQAQDKTRHSVEVSDWKHGVCDLAEKVIDETNN